jgi:hypothetical protein
MSQPDRYEQLSWFFNLQILQVLLVGTYVYLHVTPRWLSFAVSLMSAPCLAYYFLLRRHQSPDT